MNTNIIFTISHFIRMIRLLLLFFVRIILFYAFILITLPFYFFIDYDEAQKFIVKKGITLLMTIAFIGAIISLYFTTNVVIMILVVCWILKILENPKSFF